MYTVHDLGLELRWMPVSTSPRSEYGGLLEYAHTASLSSDGIRHCLHGQLTGVTGCLVPYIYPTFCEPCLDLRKAAGYCSLIFLVIVGQPEHISI